MSSIVIMHRPDDSGYGYGIGYSGSLGGCGGDVTCGLDALTFFWPHGLADVRLHLRLGGGDALELSDPDDLCDAQAPVTRNP